MVQYRAKQQKTAVQHIVLDNEDAASLAELAAAVVTLHRKHKEACDHTPLAYIDKLMDTLLAGQTGFTIRDVVADLLEMVPDLSEHEAFSLARTKFLGIGMDADLN